MMYWRMKKNAMKNREASMEMMMVMHVGVLFHIAGKFNPQLLSYKICVKKEAVLIKNLDGLACHQRSRRIVHTGRLA